MEAIRQYLETTCKELAMMSPESVQVEAEQMGEHWSFKITVSMADVGFISGKRGSGILEIRRKVKEMAGKIAVVSLFDTDGNEYHV